MKQRGSVVNPKTPIDTFPEKPLKRGRPRIEQYATISGHAANYRSMLSEKWPDLGKPLMSCQRAEDVTEAFQKHAQPYAEEFVPRLTSDIFELMRGAKFPQRANAQIKYIAESVAGRPNVTFRTSRDVCAKLRAEEGAKSPHRIIRKEFYVECECGYKGPAKNDACQKCGAQIPLSLEGLSGFRHF
jgi:hypothetical protein